MLRPLEAIAPYREAGVVVLPTEWQKKMPSVAWKMYQQRQPTDAEYERWFGAVALSGYWILCGSISLMVGLDADSPAGIEWAERVVGKDVLDRTTCVKTARGFHWYFRIPPGTILKSWSNDVIEFHGEGSGLVAPPSMHERGVQYTFVRDLSHMQPLPEAFPSTPEEPQAAPQAGPATPGRGEGLAGLLEAPASEGHRNDWLTKVAGHYAKQHEFQDGYMHSVRLANATLTPPLDDDEWRALATSIWKAEKAKPAEGCHLTDTGNSLRFIAQFGDRVRYCETWKSWLVFDGTRWVPDDTRAVDHLVTETHRSIYAEVAGCESKEGRDELKRWATASESAQKRRATLECARSEPAVATRPVDFDVDPWRLTCLNGTLDLRTGELLPHDPTDMITKVAPVEYDPAARSELWERVIDEATGGDAELAAWLQRALGYALTGDTREEVFFVLLGGTQTGKSTITNAVRQTLGGYADDVKVDTLLRQSSVGATRGDLLRLEKVRLGVVAEAERGTRMDEGLLKTFVSGEPLTVRKLYQDERSFQPLTKLFMHTNHVPTLSDDDDAVWRRARIIPFDHRPPRVDGTIKPALCDTRRSGPAILAWLVRGCLDWQRQGLGECAAVRGATAELRRTMNPLADFFDECCVFEPGAWTSADALKTAYALWAETNSVPIRQRIGDKARGESLRRHGCDDHYGRENGRQVRGWNGVELVSARSEELI